MAKPWTEITAKLLAVAAVSRIQCEAPQYDYIVIGHGRAGAEVSRELRKRRGLRLAVIDPDVNGRWATAVHPGSRTVHCREGAPLRYRHAVVIATGSHGAPIPAYLVEGKSPRRRLPEQSQQHAILGSGWEAVSLCLQAPAKPLWFYGNLGPVSWLLPSYLSLAVAKRLKARYGVQVHDRTLIRYIQSTGEETNIYTAKSYDFMESQRHSVKGTVVAAPDTTGPRGNATIPTVDVPSFLERSNHSVWYRPWSAQSGDRIVCYRDDGRIAVTPELQACHGVYAVGSVAKYAQAGHATVASGSEASQTVVHNLLHEEKRSLSEPPVWRSDQWPALSSAGITALTLGHCDAEHYATHGIWWTNQSAQRRLLRLSEDSSLSDKRTKQRVKELAKPVLGVGVVFYLDRSGRIHGIMTWGMPYSDKEGGPLKEDMMKLLRDALETNGGFGAIRNDLDLQRFSKFLETLTRKIVAVAMAGKSEDGRTHNLDGALDKFPRPLHRFTEVRTASSRSHGVLKRKNDGSQGMLGEDLFMRYEDAVQDQAPPKPIPGVGFASIDAEASRTAENLHKYALWEQGQRKWDENEELARPPKEDAIWIRKGDETRNSNARDNLMQIFASIMSGGSPSQ